MKIYKTKSEFLQDFNDLVFDDRTAPIEYSYAVEMEDDEVEGRPVIADGIKIDINFDADDAIGKIEFPDGVVEFIFCD